jgi:hypothetical protein
MKNRTIILNLFALGSLALLPAVQAVSPPPDGGYPEATPQRVPRRFQA